MAERFTRLREIVSEASLLAREEREAYLRRACAGDPELLAEARELCESAARDDGFLAPPSAARLASLLELDPTAALDDGVQVGDFKILRRIGSGGMGTVFEAEQRDPRRRVALKILRSGGSDSEGLRRFRREAELLGRLQHPSIAQIHASGVHVLEHAGERRELPYLAMEYVQGARTLLRHAREQALPLRERVRLFLDVCDAVQHGHWKGIVHRDLKPDNILVDASGRPKVIDFGVAHVVTPESEAESLLTRTGTILGTLAYMSPEQLAGDARTIDARSDVWALGVVLYQLCTQKLPFGDEPRAVHLLARAVQEEEPRRPSSIEAAIPKDLELVILKCLEKEPARRYGSAGALRADLECFLAGAAIAARPPSVRYQLRILARRHRILVTAAALVFLATVVAAVVSTRSAWQAERSRRIAERRLGEVRSLARSLMEEIHDALLPLAGSTAARELIVRTATTYLDGLAREVGDDLELLRELQQGYTRLGQIQGLPRQSNIGDLGAAHASLFRALELGRRRSQLAPKAGDVESDLVATLCALGSVELSLGRSESALERFDESLAIAPALPVRESALAALRAAAAHVFRGSALLACGRSPEALACFQGAIALTDELLLLHPAEDELLRSRSVAVLKIAELLEGRHELEAAEELLIASLPQVEARASARPGDPQATLDLDATRERLGSILTAQGRLTEAERLLRECLASLESLARADPADSDLARRLSIALETLGRLLAQSGRLEEALGHHSRALAISEAQWEHDPDSVQCTHAVAVGRLMVASVHWRLGQYEEAALAAGAALELLEQLTKRDSANPTLLRDLASAHGSLGDAAWATGRYEQAREHFDQAALRFAALLERDPQSPWLLRNTWTTRISRAESLGLMALQPDRPPADRTTLLTRAISELEHELSQAPDLRASNLLWPGDEAHLQAQQEALDSWRQSLAELGGAVD